MATNSTFTELYLSCRQPVIRAIKRRIRDAHAAEDLYQELFIDLYRNRARVHNARHWLMGGTWYVCSNYLRKERMYLESIEFDEEIFEKVARHDREPEISFVIDDALEHGGVFRSVRERELFDLVVFQGMKRTDAALALGMTIANARYAHTRTLQNLTAYLWKHGIRNITDAL